MLIGEYEHSLDSKGRMILPAKIREDLGEKFIITKGLDGCLFGFSESRFLIPANLREYADLDKEVVVTGVGTRIEIWERDKWKKYNSDENISAEQIADNMASLGVLGI